MIELTYFLELKQQKAVYQVIQPNPGEPWQIVAGNELIGRMENCMDSGICVQKQKCRKVYLKGLPD